MISLPVRVGRASHFTGPGRFLGDPIGEGGVSRQFGLKQPVERRHDGASLAAVECGQAALCEILLDLFEESDAALLLEVWQAIEE